MQAFSQVRHDRYWFKMDFTPFSTTHESDLNYYIKFLVYDGHGGSKVATHVSRNLHRQILRRPEYKNGQYEEAITQVLFDDCYLYNINLFKF